MIAGCGSYGAGFQLWQDLATACATDSAIDTVGAGDAFVAGYLSVRATRGTTGSALDRAVRTGAAVCELSGDWEGAVHLNELAIGVAKEPGDSLRATSESALVARRLGRH
ncbi:PfkB family carbohydrate kinase [Microbacterium aoyamense]|uniref:PfkB family carbohydrate kinase n=1 Tax=Microbacterium aoyamense TaxID=344166 RepID=UPI003557E6CE